MERALELFYDEIVIGADLSALAYCYINKVPLIYIRQLRPYEYGFIKDYDKQTYMYNDISYKLAFNGYMPLGDKIQAIRIEDDLIKVTTKNNNLIKISYKKVIVSDDYKVEGMPLIVGKTNYDNCVIDRFAIDERRRLDPLIKRKSRVIRTAYFTNKYLKKSRYKSFIVNSLISDKELKLAEFSETYIRLRLLRLYANKVLAFKHLNRDVYALGKNLYETPENMEILTDKYTDILNREQKKDRYFSVLESTIWKR